MNGLLDTWNALTLQRRIIVAAAGIGTVVAMLLLAQTATQPSMQLLYGNLDERSSGEMVAALDQMGVKNEIRGGRIYVPASEKDRVRLELARQGLPQQGQAGYELLDNLSGFGTTSEMFQATYWRSKEGELARTILAVPGVRAARVHIGQATKAPFARNAAPTTAAVTVTTGAGRLNERSAMSIRYLVALAVPGLEADQVAVIDAEGGVILAPGGDEAVVAQDGADRAAELEAEIAELIAARVGAENVRVSASVEVSREATTVSERIIDPDSQVAVSEESEALTENSRGAPSAVTVASNLPDGDAGAGGSSSQREQTSDKVSYRFSETQRDAITHPGAVARMGVAVLINEIATVAEDGSVSYAPRDAQELADIEALVKSAVAFDESRGDVVTVQSMRFVETAQEGSFVESGITLYVEQHLTQLIQLAVLAVAALILGLFVVRPILAPQPAALPDELTRETAEGGLMRIEGDGGEGELQALGAEQVAALPSADEGVALPDGLVFDKPDDSNLIGVLRDVVLDRTEDAANQLRNWLATELEAAKPDQDAE